MTWVTVDAIAVNNKLKVDEFTKFIIDTVPKIGDGILRTSPPMIASVHAQKHAESFKEQGKQHEEFLS